MLVAPAHPANPMHGASQTQVTARHTHVEHKEGTAKPRSRSPLSTPATVAIQAAKAQSQADPATKSGTPTSVQLYNIDGSIRMSQGSGYVAPRDATVVDLHPKNPIPCHRTKFDDSWARGQDESLGAEVARKYLHFIGLYNPEVEWAYQQRKKVHDAVCPT
jgi:hypothetical protein